MVWELCGKGEEEVDRLVGERASRRQVLSEVCMGGGSGGGYDVYLRIERFSRHQRQKDNWAGAGSER